MNTDKHPHYVVKSYSPTAVWTTRLLAISGFILALGVSYLFGQQQNSQKLLLISTEKSQLTKELLKTNKENRQLSNNIKRQKSSLMTRLERQEQSRKLAEETNHILKQNLLSEKQKHSVTQKQLYFYRRVITPDSQGSGVHIQSILIEKKAGNTYHYKLALNQFSKTKKPLFRGKLFIQIHGLQQEKAEKLLLKNISPTKEAYKKIRFRNFQILEGQWVLPEGFQPDTVNVTVKSNQSNKKPLEKSLKWEILHLP
jgi:hypothetical protein